MKKIKLATLTLLIGGICLTSCNKDDNGGDTPNNQPTEVGGVSISLNRTNIITNAGESTQLVATIAPDNATNKEVHWESSDSKVVSVDANGKLTAEPRGGTAVITAKVDDKTATCTVHVIPEGMTITNGEVTAMDNTKISTDSILGIPAIVNKIGDSAFSSMQLKQINIPESVTSIGKNAFDGCEYLTSVKLPKGLKRIENELFIYCAALTSIEIPDSVTSIGEAAFAISGLTSIEIPDSVTSIEAGVFIETINLTSIKLPKGLTEIKGALFRKCISLTSIELPDSVKSIEWDAFRDCRALTSITIPANVTKIGSSDLNGNTGTVFAGCTALESIMCMPTTPPTLFKNIHNVNDNFYDTSASLKIKVPADKVDAYKAADGWSEVAAKIEAQ